MLNSNNLNQINNEINMNQEVEDVYPYISEDKKIIKFTRYDNTIKKVKIPNSLMKNELYSTANFYKLNRWADILLSYNNLNLENDDSSIDDIIDGAEILIIEQVKDIEQDYYINYLENHKNEKLLNILFCYSNNNTIKCIKVSLNTSIKELLKIYLLEMNIPERYKDNYIFLYNSSTINNSSSLIKELINQNNSKIIVIERENIGICIKKGKVLKAKIKHKSKIIETYDIGTLNQIKDLYAILRQNIKNFNEVNKIIINGKEYQREDENRTFSSIGIKNDFSCKIEYINDKVSCSRVCLII